jgi:hypothetical protein
MKPGRTWDYCWGARTKTAWGAVVPDHYAYTLVNTLQRYRSWTLRWGFYRHAAVIVIMIDITQVSVVVTSITTFFIIHQHDARTVACAFIRLAPERIA